MEERKLVVKDVMGVRQDIRIRVYHVQVGGELGMTIFTDSGS